MSLRRGFKAEAERIASDVREELELLPTQRLDPLKLAGHLEIPVFPIRELTRLAVHPDLLRLFLTADRDSFSAVTVFYGRRRIIIHNESHARTRQASNISHELSHCLLEHPPTPAVSPEGCRYWDNDVEDEATWLGAALLIPRDGALELVKRGIPLAAIARNYGVSESLCRWRINETGVAQQVRRLSRWRRNFAAARFA